MWPFGMWVAQKGGDVFWVGFLDETHGEQYFSSPSSSSSQLLTLLIFSPPYLFINYLERRLFELIETDGT